MNDKVYHESIICFCVFALIILSFLSRCDSKSFKQKKLNLPSHCMNIVGSSAHIGEIALSEGIEYDIPNGCIVKGELPETITDIEELEYYLQQQRKK